MKRQVTSKMTYVTLRVRDILLSSQFESQSSTPVFEQGPIHTLTHNPHDNTLE